MFIFFCKKFSSTSVSCAKILAEEFQTRRAILLDTITSIIFFKIKNYNFYILVFCFLF